MARKINIKRLRKALGLSQAAFADRLGVTQPTICRLERGVMTPSKPVLKLLEAMHP